MHIIIAGDIYFSAVNVKDKISSYIKMGVLCDVICTKMGVEDFIKFLIKISINLKERYKRRRSSNWMLRCRPEEKLEVVDSASIFLTANLLLNYSVTI